MCSERWHSHYTWLNAAYTLVLVTPQLLLPAEVFFIVDLDTKIHEDMYIITITVAVLTSGASAQKKKDALILRRPFTHAAYSYEHVRRRAR